jgi:hypothetical protein
MDQVQKQFSIISVTINMTNLRERRIAEKCNARRKKLFFEQRVV